MVVCQRTKLRVLRKWRQNILVFPGCNIKRTQGKTLRIIFICTEFRRFILGFKEWLWRFLTNISTRLFSKSSLVSLKSFQDWEKGKKNLYQLHTNKISMKIVQVMSLDNIFKGSSVEYFTYFFLFF